ncbi:AAA family ATPase (plasmid) [Sorangium sp. So ce119]|uniref:AAA family ATPase n=1 Tax=Sorangium sp. So ce119 TaxID=3133279 RepID=UPI003F60D53F
MLTSVLIHNYNCFVDFTIELPRRLLIVGSNGSGKTSLWEALAGLQDVIVRSTEAASAFPTRSLTRWLHGDPVQRFAIDLKLNAETYHYEIEIVHDVARQQASIRREQLTVDGKALYEALDGDVHLYGDSPTGAPLASFPFGRKRSFLPDMEPRHDNKRAIAFREALAKVWLLAPSPRRIEPTTAGEAPWLDRDGRNFSSWFRGVLVERPGLGNALFEALRPTLPGLRNVAFERISSEVRELMLTLWAEGADYKLSAGELSDGQRSLVLLYGFLLGALDHATLAFLDEPETGLAPHEMQPWLAAMSTALEKHDGQALVSSHHPAVIDYMAPSRTVRFSRPGGGPGRIDEVTLETAGGVRVSEWLSRPWAYEDEHEEAS